MRLARPPCKTSRAVEFVRSYLRDTPDRRVLEGTAAQPLELGGIWYAAGSVTVGGHYRGRGLIVAAADIDVSRSLESAVGGARLGIARL